MKHLSTTLVMACCLSLVAGMAFGTVTPPKEFTESGTVVKTVDGDTIDVKLESGKVERIRLIGVNTPETKHPEKGVECLKR